MLSQSIILFIGFWLLLTGLIKSGNPILFILHINKLEIFPTKSGALIALILTEFECASGLALILGFMLGELIPFLILFLLLAVIVSWWGLWRGKTSDCGCYGNAFWLTPQLSSLINLVLILLLYFSWSKLRVAENSDLQWKSWLIAGFLLVVNIAFKHSLAKPLLDLSPLKKGKLWKTKWLPIMPDLSEMEQVLVVFLRLGCSECRSWIRQLDGVENLTIVGIFPRLRSKSFEPEDRHNPGFIWHKIKSWKFNHLSAFPPQGVLVKRGIISQTWQGEFPIELTPTKTGDSHASEIN